MYIWNLLGRCGALRKIQKSWNSREFLKKFPALQQNPIANITRKNFLQNYRYLDNSIIFIVFIMLYFTLIINMFTFLEIPLRERQQKEEKKRRFLQYFEKWNKLKFSDNLWVSYFVFLFFENYNFNFLI